MADSGDEMGQLRVNSASTSTKLLLYLCFLSLGVTTLLPWNLFITAAPYFYYKFAAANNSSGHGILTVVESLIVDHNTSTTVATPRLLDSETYYQETFLNWFTIVGSISAICGTLLSVYLSNRLSNNCRNVGGHLLLIGCLLIILTLTVVDTESYETDVFFATLVLLAVASVATNGIIGGSVLSLASLVIAIDSSVQAVVLGYAIGGVIPSVAAIVSEMAVPTPRLSGIAYFSFSLAFALFTLAISQWLVYSGFVQKSNSSPTIDMLPEEQQRLLVGEEESDETIPPISNTAPISARNVLLKVNLRMLLFKIWPEMLIVVLVFSVTLSVFPALTSKVKSTSKSHFWIAYFTPIACFLAFNSADALGRLLTLWSRTPRPHGLLRWLLVVSRVAVAVGIFFCNAEPRHVTQTHLNDATFVALVLLLAVTNGFFISDACITASQRFTTEEANVGGSLIQLVNTLAISFGCIISYFVVQLL